MKRRTLRSCVVNELLTSANLLFVTLLSSAGVLPADADARGDVPPMAAVRSTTAISNADRRLFLAEHNHWRSSVQPTAGDMLTMVYTQCCLCELTCL